MLAVLLPAKAAAQDDDEDYDPNTIFWTAVLTGLVYTFVGGYSVENHLHNGIAPYPYLNGNEGNYTTPDADVRNFRVDAENRLLFADNSTFGNHLNVKLRPLRYFSLHTNVFRVEEFSGSSKNPSFTILDSYFCYDRLRFLRFNLGWMLGLYHVQSIREQHGGISGGFSLDWFVHRPVSIHSSIRWAGGAYFSCNNFSLIARYHHKKIFASAGYETLRAFNSQRHFAAAGFGIYL